MSKRQSVGVNHLLDLAPPHWRAKRAKYLFSEVAELSVSGTETLLSVTEQRGVVPRETLVSEGEELSRAESLVGYKRCQAGDLVMNIMLAWKRALGVADQAGIVSPSYAVFRPHGLNSRFAHYLLRSDPYIDDFNRRSTGIVPSRNRLYPEEFGNTVVLLPPFEEQRRIAAFLDHETARIDELVHEQQRLNDLLTEKHQATITYAVTRGLHEIDPFTDSFEANDNEHDRRVSDVSDSQRSTITPVNPAFIRRKPPRWGLAPLFAVVRPRNTKNVGMREDNLLSLSYGRIVRRDINTNEGLLPESFETYQIVEPGDIVFRLTDLQNDQRSLRTALVHERGIITSAYLALEPTGIHPEYFAYLIRAYDQDKTFYRMGSGLRQSLKFEELRRLPVFMPPYEEQCRIAAFLDNETERVNKLRAKQDKNIELLLERRSALISAAVTGQLDLRDWQPPKPQTVSEVI